MSIFRNRNFTLLFTGRILTNIGDSLYAVAAMWLVYDMSGSSFYTGLAGFLSFIPRFIQLLSGPLIDRLPIRGVLMYSQLIQGILLLIIPMASYLNLLSISLVLAITPILSICNTWVYPAQMSALPKILERKQLTQGNSLFAVTNQGIDVACNGVSGVLIGLLGAVSLYLWNSLGFFIGAILFSQLRIASSPTSVKAQSSPIQEARHLTADSTPVAKPQLSYLKTYFSELVTGIYMITKTSLSTLLFGIILINAAGGATFSVLPMYSSQFEGAELYGLMLMSQALGSLVGALCAPYLRLERIPLGLLYSFAFILSGLAWCFSVFSPWPGLTIVVYGLAWFPGGAVNVVIHTVVQKGVPQQYLGRIFAATSALSGIAMPLGSLIGGSLGVWLSGGTIIAICGATVVLVGTYWLVNKDSRNLPATEYVTEDLFRLPNKLASVN